jgi:TetR/AcrR family transcriptional regulator, lmrAB and yxaGH operons repressor
MPRTSAAPASTPSSRDGTSEPDTRTRILRAALKLFRQHGYHGVGINDILALAEAPKGSMYHHFPGGKEEIGAAVVAHITTGVRALIEAQPPSLSAAAVVQRVADALQATLARTRHELCALFAAFSAERSSAPLLAAAVSQAYADIASVLEARLAAGGASKREARERAALVIMLFEGGSLLAAAQQGIAPFRLAARHAARVCDGSAT